MWVLASSLLLSVTVLVLPTTWADSDDTASMAGPRHYKDNPVWDHNAMFKGPRKNVESTNSMSKETKRRRLLKLAKSHDANDDGLIDARELRAWLEESDSLWYRQDVIDQMLKYNVDKDKTISLVEVLAERHKDLTAKKMTELEKKLDSPKHLSQAEQELIRLINNNRLRFNMADLDHNGSLDEAEFQSLIRPHTSARMATLEMDIAMEFGDLDGDKVISINEFVKEDASEDDRRHAEEKFHELDTDKDGRLSRHEMHAHILPEAHSDLHIQVISLIEDVDKNGDKRISTQELVESEGEFIFSIITDFARNLFFIKDDGVNTETDTRSDGSGSPSKDKTDSKAEDEIEIKMLRESLDDKDETKKENVPKGEGTKGKDKVKKKKKTKEDKSTDEKDVTKDKNKSTEQDANKKPEKSTAKDATSKTEKLTKKDATKKGKKSKEKNANKKTKKSTDKDAKRTPKKSTGKDATEETKKSTGKDATEETKKSTGKDATEETKKSTGKDATEETKKSTEKDTTNKTKKSTEKDTTNKTKKSTEKDTTNKTKKSTEKDATKKKDVPVPKDKKKPERKDEL